METAAWIPGWYELDPPLEVGLIEDFVFWRVVPEYLQGPESLVLFNTLWNPVEAVVARGTIESIRHPELGEINKVDTRGLDYTITLADSTELLVNAEEQPGYLYERVNGQWTPRFPQVTDWRFVIVFASLDERKPA